MKLLYTRTSPFARKVLVCALELGIGERVERVEVNPFDEATPLFGENPLGKVPALVTDDPELGTLIDSPLICEYLHHLVGGSSLFPAAGIERWRALYAQSLADGVMDAAVLLRLESLRPEAASLSGTDSGAALWNARWGAAIDRSVAELERRAGQLRADAPTIGDVATACALAYLDFRHAERPWRPAAPALDRWLAQWSERPSFAATAHPAS